MTQDLQFKLIGKARRPKFFVATPRLNPTIRNRAGRGMPGIIATTRATARPPTSRIAQADLVREGRSVTRGRKSATTLAT